MDKQSVPSMDNINESISMIEKVDTQGKNLT